MSRKKRDRTKQYEDAVKTAIMNDAVIRQLDEDLSDLQQKRFDRLLKACIICSEDIYFEGDFTL
jgi:hypothetical protein